MKTDEAPAPTAAAESTGVKLENVTLDTPVQRGSQTISSIDLRKPRPGEMRGLNMRDIVQGDVGAMLTLLPRITVPPLLPQEVENLDPPDFVALTGAVMGFFMSKAEIAMARQMMGQEPTSSA